MDIELIDTPAAAPAPSAARAIAANPTPADLLRIAVEGNADIGKLERLMALQQTWEAAQARKAYDTAFAAFKAEAVAVIKNKRVTDGPLKGKTYADLFAVVDSVTPALSKHGLTASWKLTKDIPAGDGQPGWLEVTCYLRHTGGHTETASMGGPPDAGGAKNSLQARASTKSYLERYTLMGVLGMAAQEQDDDGRGGRQPQAPTIPPELLQAARDKALEGWKALGAYIKTLTDEQVRLLEPESDNLKAAAKQADAAKAGAK